MIINFTYILHLKVLHTHTHIRKHRQTNPFKCEYTNPEMIIQNQKGIILTLFPLVLENQSFFNHLLRSQYHVYVCLDMCSLKTKGKQYHKLLALIQKRFNLCYLSFLLLYNISYPHMICPFLS